MSRAAQDSRDSSDDGDPRCCPRSVDSDALAAYVSGTLGPEAAAMLEVHLDECRECRWLVYALVREDGLQHPHDDLAGGALPAGARVGRYLVERPIGAGGMGVVYAAHDVDLGRRVALKTLRDGGGQRARVVDEARAMARVSHPNVTAVYDVVECGLQVYVAMELVDGHNLEVWLAERPRSRRAIFDAFLAAGAGLAAVHAAGLVHGDFKPRNVLVANDGRVQVTDLGLARMVAGAAGDSDGVVRGTPAYMAPELRRGARATPASDQYAFCLALREGLARAAPRGWERRLVTRRRVELVIQRGLEPSPDGRHASMDVLLARLRGALAPRWRRAALVVAGAAAALAAVLAYQAAGSHAASRAAMAACEAGGELAGTWDAGTRRAIADALFATRAPFAADAWRGVDRALGSWARAYAEQRHAACAATWIAETQPPSELDARLGCLADRRRAADALIGVLSRADRATANNAVTASTLPSPRTCGDRATLLRQPVRPHSELLALRVEAVRYHLADVKAMEDTGRYRDALPAAERVVREAEATAFDPVIAEAVFRLGSVQFGAASAETLLRAAGLADQVGDDALRARAWIRIIRVDYEAARGDRLALARAQATAALVRARATPLEWAELAQAVGVLQVALGELDDGERQLRRALELREAEGGSANYLVARTLSSLGIAHAMRGDTRGALADLRRVATMFEQELGPLHPRVAGAHMVLGQALVADLQAAAAVPELELAIRIAQDDDQIRGSASTSLGYALTELGEHTRALEHFERGRAIWHGVRADHPRKAYALLGIGLARLGLREVAAAVSALDEAIAITDTSPIEQAEMRFVLAQALDAAGDPGTRARATALAREALRLYDGAMLDPRSRRDRDRARTWLAPRGGVR